MRVLGSVLLLLAALQALVCWLLQLLQARLLLVLLQALLVLLQALLLLLQVLLLLLLVLVLLLVLEQPVCCWRHPSMHSLRHPRTPTASSSCHTLPLVPQACLRRMELHPRMQLLHLLVLLQAAELLLPLLLLDSVSCHCTGLHLLATAAPAVHSRRLPLPAPGWMAAGQTQLTAWELGGG